MRYFFKILYIKGVALNFNDGAFVFINIAVVRSTKYGYNSRELLRFLPIMNFVALHLHLMRSDN